MATTKTHWKLLSDTNYLGSYSFNDEVKEIVLTINKIESQEVTNPIGKKELCRVAFFVEDDTIVNGVEVKPMILNKTNCERIEKLYGTPYIEDWSGKRIIVMKTITDFAGEKVDCLRIKLETPPFEAKKPVQTTQYNCSICGKAISEKVYKLAMEKFGVAVCSKECAEKIEQNQNKEENN